MKFSVPSTSSSPQRPQLRNASARAAISPSGFGAVEVGGVLGRARSSDRSATQRTTWVPRPAIEPVMTSPSRRKRFQCWPLPAGLPVSRRSPGSSGIVWEAPEMSAAMSKSRSSVDPSCMTSPLSSRRTFRSARVDERRRHEERAGRQEAGRVLGAVPVGADLLHVLAEHEVARGDVVDDRVAGDVVERVLAGDAERLAADHDREFELPVVHVAVARAARAARRRRRRTRAAR